MISGTKGRKRLGKAQHKVTRRQPPIHWPTAERRQFCTRRTLEDQRSAILGALDELAGCWACLDDLVEPIAERKDRIARELKARALDIGYEAERLEGVARDLLEIVLAAEEGAWR
jgi:hypothetical protein